MGPLKKESVSLEQLDWEIFLKLWELFNLFFSMPPKNWKRRVKGVRVIRLVTIFYGIVEYLLLKFFVLLRPLSLSFSLTRIPPLSPPLLPKKTLPPGTWWSYGEQQSKTWIFSCRPACSCCWWWSHMAQNPWEDASEMLIWRWVWFDRYVSVVCTWRIMGFLILIRRASVLRDSWNLCAQRFHECMRISI